MMNNPNVLLTKDQVEFLEAQRLDFQRHNTWRILTRDGTDNRWGPCLCSRCNADAIKPDVRED